MALPQIISRNQIQKSNKRTREWSTSTTSETFYTCPAGKIASIKGRMVCTAFGASTEVDLQVAGIAIATWIFSPVGTGIDINFPEDLAVNFVYPFVAELTAGDTLATVQNSGTNASNKLQFIIEEFII